MLALGAGYLINKNLVMQNRLQEKVHEYNSATLPADPGPPTSEIRKVQRTVHLAENYRDVNVEKLPSEQVRALGEGAALAQAEVSAYESAGVSLNPIQGVYLIRGNGH